MADLYAETNLIDAITANGDYPETMLALKNDRVLGFYGNLGGATVSFIFFTEKPDETFVELPASPDWTFASIPAVERFAFSKTLPFKVRVTGATGTTNFGINTHELN